MVCYKNLKISLPVLSGVMLCFGICLFAFSHFALAWTKDSTTGVYHIKTESGWSLFYSDTDKKLCEYNTGGGGWEARSAEEILLILSGKSKKGSCTDATLAEPNQNTVDQCWVQVYRAGQGLAATATCFKNGGPSSPGDPDSPDNPDAPTTALTCTESFINSGPGADKLVDACNNGANFGKTICEDYDDGVYALKTACLYGASKYIKSDPPPPEEEADMIDARPCRGRVSGFFAWLLCPAGDWLSRIIDWCLYAVQNALRWNYLIPDSKAEYDSAV